MTALPVYTAADFGEALLRLLPTGRAWPRDTDAVLGQAVRLQGAPYARMHARANYLLTDAFPATAVELLPEWEATLGLPDPCAGPDQTLARRQAHVVARLTQQDGPSVPSLVAYAATLGYAIKVDEFTPRRFGQPFGGRYYGLDWAHTWRIDAPAVVVTPRRFGGRFGERYATWSGSVLECEMARIKPAHTILLFSYAGSIGAPLDQFVFGRNVLL